MRFKTLAILLVLSLLVVFTGCSNQDEDDRERLDEIAAKVATLFNEEQTDIVKDLDEEIIDTIEALLAKEVDLDHELSEENESYLQQIITDYELATAMMDFEKSVSDLAETDDEIDEEVFAKLQEESEAYTEQTEFHQRITDELTTIEEKLEKQIAEKKAIEKAKKAVAKLFKDDKVKNDVTKDAYETASKAVEKIKDKTIKKKLTEKLTKVDTKLQEIAEAKKAEKEKAEREKKEAKSKQASVSETDSKGSSGSNASKGNNSNSGGGNVVDQMKNLGNSRQVILITTKGYNTYQGQVRTFEKDSNGKWHQKLSATAYIGKNGFADNKVEGDLKSPTGKYSIGHAFGYAGDPGTKLSFKHATSNDVWVDDSNSKYYNTWQSNDKGDKDWNSAESMTHELYKYGFVINYNTAQTPNKGSAIFMHVARPGSGYTTGCTATNQSDLLTIMRWIDPGKNPVIIQTPESGLSNY